jgi:hypothetical protein
LFKNRHYFNRKYLPSHDIDPTLIQNRHYFCRKYFRTHNIDLRWKAEFKCKELDADSHLASCLTEKDAFFLAFTKRKDEVPYALGISDM